jgi:dipeptidyl aminopeptidase/acylaminoacyl peptidase
MNFNACYRLLIFFCLVMLVGCHHGMVESNSVADPSRMTRQYTIEQFLGTTHLQGNSFSPDKSKILVSSDERGIYNAYAIPTGGSRFVQHTDFKRESIRVLDYFPHDERFLYLADQGGNELEHLYIRELDGTDTDLTPGNGHLTRFLGWAHDGKSLFLSTNERDHRYFDIYEVRVEGYQRTMIYKDVMGYEFREMSPDKRTIAFIRTNRREDTDILLYDRPSASMQNLTSHKGDAEYRHQSFSPNGESLLFTTNQGSEFSYLIQEHLHTGQRKVILQPAWDVTFAKFSHHGKYLIVGINREARKELEILDGKTLDRLELPRLPEGDITSVIISRDETMMAFYTSTSRTPKNLYVYDFSTKETKRLTHTLNPEIDIRDLVEGTVIRFASYDGLEIPGILYKPHEASPQNKVPALVWVHGGPGGQSRMKYHALIQYLVNHGYAIFAINNRGSSGYGKSFFTADDHRHGQADLDDCVASKSMLVDTGYIDPERIGIIGISYGGYLSLAAMTFRPKAFAIGVDIFGISNWIHTLQNMPPWWESLREALYVEIGHPKNDREYLKSISPLFHADRIIHPLLVLQGANDPRVVKSESDNIVAAARGNRAPVEYHVFEDEGHSFRKKENRKQAYRLILNFLDKHLKSIGKSVQIRLFRSQSVLSPTGS